MPDVHRKSMVDDDALPCPAPKGGLRQAGCNNRMPEPNTELPDPLGVGTPKLFM